MKKLFLTIISVILLFGSCDFLDIVPDEIPTEDKAFSTPNAALNYLYSCYSFLPDPRHSTQSIDWLTSDDVITSFEHTTMASFAQGTYSPAQPVISYWNDLFAGIRQTYIFINRIDGVPNLNADEKLQMKGEATFLVAYFHYLLLKNYGPIIIVENVIDMDTPESEYSARKPYDQCVDWIADKFDEAASMLPPRQTNASYYGRATSVAALAIKARMLLYAASPQFNGGKSSYPDTEDLTSWYADFKDENGNLLISTTYDPTKWERAATANLEAITFARNNGHDLYYDVTEPETTMPEPADPTQRRLRMSVPDKYTQEFLWCSTIKEDQYGLQNKSTPFIDLYCWNGVAPTLMMLETFYTENGLPIDVDPAYNYSSRYNYSAQSNGDGVTLNLNMGREPRFYSWVAFHNSYYEVSRSGNFKMKVMFRRYDDQGMQNRTNNYSPTGYLNKKGVHPLHSRTASNTGNSWPHYPWPVIRLAELYLNYAEALIEIGGDANLATAKTYIDLVRERAGIKGLDESWAATGLTLTQDRMRDIVRQERTIELYLENQRFWDVRRWLVAKKYMDVRPKGMNILGETDAEFFQITEVSFTRNFTTPNNYLMPIPQTDINKNPKILQNPGY